MDKKSEFTVKHENTKSNQTITQITNYLLFHDRVDKYLERHADYCIRHIGMLPTWVTPDDVVKHFTIRDIRTIFRGQNSNGYFGLGVFAYEFAKVGGDIDLLADKAIAEMGYPEDEDDLMALAVMKMHGAKNIDANKIIDSLTLKAYYYTDPESVRKVNEWFYDILLDHLDDAHKAHLRK